MSIYLQWLRRTKTKSNNKRQDHQDYCSKTNPDNRNSIFERLSVTLFITTNYRNNKYSQCKRQYEIEKNQKNICQKRCIVFWFKDVRHIVAYKIEQQKDYKRNSNDTKQYAMRYCFCFLTAKIKLLHQLPPKHLDAYLRSYISL